MQPAKSFLFFVFVSKNTALFCGLVIILVKYVCLCKDPARISDFLLCLHAAGLGQSICVLCVLCFGIHNNMHAITTGNYNLSWTVLACGK